MSKGVIIDFKIDTGHTQSNFPQYVYTGLTADSATGLTVCNGVTGNTCNLVGLDDALPFIYVKITCNGCDDQIFKVEYPTPTPTLTPTLTLTPTYTITPTLTPTHTLTLTPTLTPTITPTINVSETPTLTPTVTITQSITPTQTITPTQSITPTQTITPTTTPIDPTYFYYSLGDCTDMRYSGIETTNFGFGSLLQIPVCMTQAQITEYYSTMNWGQQSLTIDYNNPCGFGTGFTGSYIGRSLTQLTEGDVYTYSGACYSIVELDPQYVTSYDLEMSSLGSPETGLNPCGACDPPFTGFTIMGYSGLTCDTEEPIIAYSILGGFTLGNVYGIQLYSGGTIAGDAICMTLTAEIGPQFTITDPETQGITGYQISDAGPFNFPPTFSGYTDCTACNSVDRKYLITGERCDTNGSISLWSATLPTIQVGNTFQVDDTYLSSYCWMATQVDQYKSVVYNDLGISIASTGCDCNGNNGGGDINVTNIDFVPSQFSDTGSECQSPMGQYYSETTSTEMQLTFKDSGSNLVTPNDTVQYRVNGGSWVTLPVTSSTVSFSVTLIYGDNSNCSLGGPYADTLDIKVGTITVEYYTAGQ